MNRFFTLRRIALSLVVVALVGIVLPASADEDVPFLGRADVVVTGIEPAPDGLHLTASATGLATHLGLFTREESVVLNPLTGTFAGTLEFIAADGSRLYADAEGGFISATTALGTYTITGGTGRFENATAGANFVAVTSDLIHIALTFEGTITF
ncbi:MAG: hypothetical protein L0Y72_18855 [Gemmataceae bacterium]|nr:hypothetical protein [Gemmataceae bacterium]